MRKTTSDGGANPLNISPIQANSKHQTTPLRTKRKTSRRDQGTDVHTTCSTPNRLQSSVPCSSWNSPSDSFPYSQENRPDVIWDYTSPKLPKGSKRKEIKITVDEFLKNLTQHQAPECNTQTSNYIKLLEKWMAKQNSPISVRRPPKNVNRDNKKRSRRVMEEIKQFMESIQKKNEDIPVENNQTECTDEINISKAETLNPFNISLNRKSFLEGDHTENDSTDDLWGEVDNSFIVKATQQLDVSSLNYNVLDKNLEFISTIPETVCNTSNELKCTISEMEHYVEKKNIDKEFIDSDCQAQILLTQIISEWDVESYNDDWDNGFIEEDDALSLIPDEVLCGTDSKHGGNFIGITESCEVQHCSSETAKGCENKKQDRHDSSEIVFGGSETDRDNYQEADGSETELFNNFEDESFGDESILCKPEVLSWIDEVESKLSQSIRCTPEEIEKKKDEAIQRLKKHQSGTKFS